MILQKILYIRVWQERIKPNEDAENLEIAMGKPIQSFTTTGFNVFGEVIEFSLARYRGDRSRFEVSANI